MYYVYTYYGVSKNGHLSVFNSETARDTYERLAKKLKFKYTRVSKEALHEFIELATANTYDAERMREFY